MERRLFIFTNNKYHPFHSTATFATVAKVAVRLKGEKHALFSSEEEFLPLRRAL